MSQLLLAVDTSGKNGSVALAEVKAGQADVKILESVPLAGGTFSAQLIPQVAALLAKHGYSRLDVAGFVAVSGPGSFTGLRVGLAAIKALGEVLHKPIAAVSLLEASAFSGKADGRALAALDAGRGEVYLGDYEVPPAHAGSPKMFNERLVTREEFLLEASMQAVVSPDAGLAELLQSQGIPCEQIAYPETGVIAGLGWERIQRGQTVRPEDLEANYIRRSDAEILSRRKA